jgi:hypothetical protein
MNAFVHIGHEFVEMRAAFVLDRALLEKHVHQHGLAAADLTMNIETARRRLVLVRKQPAEQALLADRLVARKPLLQGGEGLRGMRLRGIGLNRAGRDEGLIMGVERGGRGGQHDPPYGPNPAKIASRELVQGVCACRVPDAVQRALRCAAEPGP